MRMVYNYNAIVADTEKYIKENGRFLYVPFLKKPHEILYKVLSVSRRTYFLWLKNGVLDFSGVVQFDEGTYCNVYDLRRLLDKIKSFKA